MGIEALYILIKKGGILDKWRNVKIPGHVDEVLVRNQLVRV